MHFELKIPPVDKAMTDDEFFEFCRQNRDMKFERNAQGQIIFIMPTGGKTGRINSEVNAELIFWNRSNKSGIVFDSSTGFKLPNQATRSPDAAWVSRRKWEQLLEEEKKKFPPICPDFVIEIRSENDSLAEVNEKMEEYLENGSQLGWLLDPIEQKAYIYRPNQEKETVGSFDSVLTGENILVGFELDLKILL